MMIQAISAGGIGDVGANHEKQIPITSMIFNPIKSLGQSYAVFQEIRVAMDRLWWLESIEEEQGGSNRLIDFQKEILYDGINHSYSYSRDLILENIDFKIKKGEAVAIFGPSGAGENNIDRSSPKVL